MFHENPGGPFRAYNPRGVNRTFMPTGPARHYGLVLENPGKLGDWSKYGRTQARLFVGLTRGTGERAGEEINREEVIDVVTAVRAYQLDAVGRWPGGGSIIAQRGYFTDWRGQSPRFLGKEKSLQLLFFPEDFPESQEWREEPGEVVDRMLVLAGVLAGIFDQRSVIVDVEISGQLAFLGDYSPVASEDEIDPEPEETYPHRLALSRETDRLIELWHSGELPVPEAED